MKIYKYNLILKIVCVIILYFSWDEFFSAIEKDGNNYIIIFLSNLMLTYFVINAFYHKIIIDEEKISFITIFSLAWCKSIEWINIRKIHRESYYGFSIFIIIPEKGKSMYLAGYKDTTNLLKNIYEKAPHILLHPDVKKRIGI